jgi:tetratricopeptide (TPR) repeat protein
MDRRVARATRIFLVAAFCTAAHAGAARAEQEKGAAVEAVQPWAYKRLERAYAALHEERYEDTLAALDEMKDNPKLNGHERSLMWQTYGYVYSARDEYAGAVESFERCLAAGGLAEQAELQTRYNLAQLYVMLERYDDAIGAFDYWFARTRNPAPTAYYMMAMAHVQKGEREAALRWAEKAIEASPAPRESWLQLLVALRLEAKRYAETVPVLDQLLARYPKKNYWVQLSAVYSELGAHEKALATLELAHLQGLLTEGNELMGLAQLYLYNQIPYRAAEVLEEGIESGAIEATSRAWQLLADSWLHARERERALPPLVRAAELAEDGNVYMRLAQVQVEQERWSEARQAIEAALAKGGLDRPGHAHLLLGIACASEKRWSEAEESFHSAERFEETEKVARHWLEHLASQRDVELQEQRQASGGDAEKKA